MILWNIQCLKVIIIILNLWTIDNIKAHSYKDFFNLIKNNRKWVLIAKLMFLSWKCNIKLFCRKLCISLFSFYVSLCRFKKLCYIFSHFICKLSYYRTLLRRKLTHLL